jgi:integrase
MIFRMRLDYLVERKTKAGVVVFQYRREVPAPLRSILGVREIKRTLRTSDESEARKLWADAHTQAERMIAEAEAGRKSPAIAAYKAVADHQRGDERQEEGLDLHITTLLDQNHLDPTLRASLEALLKRDEHGGEDNPPLTILAGRYYAEKKMRPKTKLEWEGVIARFVARVGDLPVKAISQANVRTFKLSLLATKGRTGGTLSPATVRKSLGALAAVLQWAQNEGYLTINPAARISIDATDSDETGRLPYSAEDLKVIFRTKREGDANHWLPWLALYTGARLEELGQLRVADVRHEDGVDYLAIEPGDGKRVKTKSSRRRVPLHPELIKLGFLDFKAKQEKAGEIRLFPELKATRFSLTGAWSKYWGRHARSLGITDPRKVTTFLRAYRRLKRTAARGGRPMQHETYSPRG